LNCPRPNLLNLDPARVSELKQLFAGHHLRPQKSLGQHFLVVPEIADKIVALLELTPDDKVLEIGPGAGALTLRLAQARVNLLALEIDSGLAALLSELLDCYGPKEILAVDVLQADFSKLLGDEGWKLVGNLPYNLTGPILGKILERPEAFSRAILMLQKEVVARLTAPSGGKDYGALSVMAQNYFEVRREIAVKRANFYPPPEVDSAVISFSRKSRPAVAADKQSEFRKLLQGAFAHRRKKLENSLADAAFVANRGQGEALLIGAAVGLGRRAESLNLEEFARLFHYWENSRKNELD